MDKAARGQHVDRLVCGITKAPLDEDTMQATARLLREEADIGVGGS